MLETVRDRGLVPITKDHQQEICHMGYQMVT